MTQSLGTGFGRERLHRLVDTVEYVEHRHQLGDRQLVADALGKVSKLQLRPLVQGGGARGDQCSQPRAVNLVDLAQGR